ncbi:unnamed protein product [Cladocopium goreaui]|uniref:Uncharacterized protein n=1 Tax=Cladocopium goreaui TaxID=2562237 RepID=A0A9P1M1B7_9DINO|nr:unnamed protein product [Cladocopium goreaui]|mmetsp:Transcript_34440/g.74365  ORF Transcript_34440/g.74365 Transcript_34440/m.74365 type:complete len:191 (+) Transcript_34440:57-629(+)
MARCIRRSLSVTALAALAVMFWACHEAFVLPQLRSVDLDRSRSSKRAFQQGKVNLNVEGALVKSRNMPEPILEANEATTVAIQDCLDEGCSVEALMELDQKLARDEAKIKDALDKLHDIQSQEYSEDSAEQIAWLGNFLDRCGSLRAQLMAVKTLEEPDFASQLMRAAAVAFGGGRHGDYPKVGVSPYSS